MIAFQQADEADDIFVVINVDPIGHPRLGYGTLLLLAKASGNYKYIIHTFTIRQKSFGI